MFFFYDYSKCTFAYIFYAFYVWFVHFNTNTMIILFSEEFEESCEYYNLVENDLSVTKEH